MKAGWPRCSLYQSSASSLLRTASFSRTTENPAALTSSRISSGGQGEQIHSLLVRY